MARLTGAVVGDGADDRVKQLTFDGVPVSLVGYSVKVKVWAHRSRVTILDATILDALEGLIFWPLGTFLLAARNVRACYNVEYVRIRDSDQAELTWPSEYVDHLPVRARSLVSP